MKWKKSSAAANLQLGVLRRYVGCSEYMKDEKEPFLLENGIGFFLTTPHGRMLLTETPFLA